MLIVAWASEVISLLKSEELTLTIIDEVSIVFELALEFSDLDIFFQTVTFCLFLLKLFSR